MEGDGINLSPIVLGLMSVFVFVFVSVFAFGDDV